MARVHQVQFVSSRRATCLDWKELVTMQMSKEIRDWVNLAQRQGWSVEPTTNSRLEWKPADKSKGVIHTSVKPVGSTVKHVRRLLEAAGLRFEETRVPSQTAPKPAPPQPEVKAKNVTPSQALDVLIDYVASREGDTADYKKIAKGLSDELTVTQEHLHRSTQSIIDIQNAFMLPPWKILEKIADIVGVNNPIGE